MSAAWVANATRCYHDCPRCHGTGGPPPIWDEDTSRSVVYVCSQCSGSGLTWHWTDDGCE